MEDLTPALLSKIQKKYQKELKSNPRVALLEAKVKSKNASYVDVDALAYEYGRSLAIAFKEIKGADLPNQKLYYNIADKLITPMLRENSSRVIEACVSTQEALNEKAKIGLKAKAPRIDTEKIHDLAWKASQYETYEEAKWLLDVPVIANSQAVVVQSIKDNAEFQNKAGLKPKIVRTSSGHCCKWCDEVAGVYRYPDVPRDVYRRHRGCTCSVDYYPGDGRVQNVHSRQWYSEESEEAKRKYDSLKK